VPQRTTTRTMIPLLLFLVLTASQPTAQTKTSPEYKASNSGKERKTTVFEEFPSSLGVTFASIETFGLSWKRWFGKTGLELCVGGTWDPSNLYGPIYYYSVTGALSHRLYAEDFADWFSGGLYLVLYGGHAGEDGYVYDADLDVNVRTGYKPYVYAGAGIGLETVLFRHFSQEVQFLYIGQFLNDPGIGFGVNFSLRYRY